MLLHEKVVDVLNPLAREFKSIGTIKKELAELQDELAQAHNEVFLFFNSKCKRCFHNRLRPTKLTWPAMYRKQHKKWRGATKKLEMELIDEKNLKVQCQFQLLLCRLFTVKILGRKF